MSKLSSILALLAVAFALLPALAWADAWDLPPDSEYYDTVDLSGDGEDLKESLTAVMSAGHIQRTYGDFRFSAAITDKDPNPSFPNNILLVYNRASVPATWDSGTTWNREHTWPDSHQPQDADNNDIGAIADPHMLRPANPGINTSRGNKPYGWDSTTGGHGAVASGYYFPGDVDKGDMARTFFYADTRWTSSGFSLVDTVPSGFQMGDRSSLINWHYLDVPDEFERRRNHTIYSQAYNPSYYTNNRNAYVDNPEYVWSVYMDQLNDTQITISGGTSVGNGGTTRDVDLGRVFVGGAVPAGQNFSIIETGNDGTYYEVTAAEDATSSVNGKYNAFAMNAVGSRSITVGLDTSLDTTASAGLKSGTVTIDNLDVTTGFGAGHGDLDDNDVFNVSLAVVDHATPSFDGMAQDTELMFDFGSLMLGAVDPIFDFDLFNLESTLGFTADLDFDSLMTSGDTGVFSSDLAAAAGSLSLDGGDSQGFTVTFDTASIGAFSATYTLSVSDEDLTGALNDVLTLTVMGQIIGEGGGLFGDYNGNNQVDAADYTVWRDALEAAETTLLNDPTPGTVSESDYLYWRNHFGEMLGGGAGAGSAVVPEPASLFLLLAGSLGLPMAARRRGRRAG